MFAISSAAIAGPVAVIEPREGTVIVRNDTREVNLRNGAGNITIRRFVDNVTVGGADNTAVTTTAISGATTINISDNTTLVGEIGGVSALAKQDGNILINGGAGTRVVGLGDNGITARTDGGNIRINALGGASGLISGVDNGVVAQQTGTGRVDIIATSNVIGDRDKNDTGTGIAVVASGGTVNVVSQSVAGAEGIVIRNQDVGTSNGDVSVTTNGATRGRSGDGIRTIVTGDGTNTVTVNADVTGGAKGDGIDTHAAAGLTNVTVNAGATVQGGESGIQTQSGSGRTVITVGDGAVIKGGAAGIDAHSDSGSLLIKGSANIVGSSGDAISADIDSGAGDLEIRAGGVLRGGRHGILARNDGTGAVTITNTGAVKGDNIGIVAVAASGPLTVTGRGSVTGSKGDGIAATILAGDNKLEITPSGDIRAGQTGISAQQLGSGDVLVRTDGTVTGGLGAEGKAIEVSANGGTTTVITHDDVAGDEGIVVTNKDSGAKDGNVVVRAEGAVRGRTGDAIRSDVTGQGSNTVVVGGDVAGGPTGQGITTAAAAGLTKITVKAGASVKGGENGIVAISRTGGIEVTGAGDITGQSAAGVSLTTESAQPVKIDLSGNVRGATDGISVVNSGTGGFSINVEKIVKADTDDSGSSDDTAISAFAGKGNGTITIGRNATVAGPTGISVGAVAGHQVDIVNNGTVRGGINGGTTLSVLRGNVTLTNNGTFVGNVSSTQRTQSFTITNGKNHSWIYTRGLVSQLAGKADSIVNNGTFDASKGPASFIGLESFQNNGQMNIATFAMEGKGDLVNSGTITVKNNSVLSFTGGADLVNAAGGKISFNNATVNGGIDNAGTLTLADKISLTITDGDLTNRNGGLIDANNAKILSAVANDGTFLVGKVAVTGDVTNTGTIKIKGGGSLSVSGDLLNSQGGLIDADNAKISADLTNQGAFSLNRVSVVGDVVNSGTITIKDGGSLTVTGGDLFNRKGGLIQVESARITANLTNDGTIDLGDNLTADRVIVKGAVSNSGGINLRDKGTGDQFVVNGNMVGSKGSSVALDVDVVTEGKSNTDSVRVKGTTSGETNLVLNLVDSKGNDVELRDRDNNIVDAIDTSQSQKEDLHFSNGQLYDKPVVLINGDAGGFDITGADSGDTLARSGFINYVLGTTGGGDVTLSSELDRNQAGGVVASFSSTLSTIDTIFHKPSSALVSSCTGAEKNGVGYATWARANGGNIDTKTEGTATIGKDSQNVSTKNKTDFYGFQGGLDTVFCDINPNGASLHVGLTGGYIEGTSDQQGGGFSTDFNSYFFGAYTALISGNFSADASIRYAIHNMDLSHEDTSIIEKGTDTDGDTIAGSVSGTYRFMLSDTVRLAPSAGLTIARTSIDDFKASGGTVSFSDETSIIGYAGLGLSKAFQVSDSMLLIPLVQASVYHEFEDQDDAAFELGNVRANIQTDKISTYGQLTAGLQTHISGDPSSNEPTFTGGIRFDAQVGKQIEGWAVGAEGRIQF